MQQVEVEATIAAPRELVWRVYTDHVSWEDWAKIGKVHLAREGASERDGKGCVRVIRNGPVSVHEEIVEFEAPRRMVYRVVKGGLPMKNHRGEVEFTDVGDGTLINWRCRFDSKVPLLGAPMRWIVSRVFRQTLSALQRYPFAAGAHR